MSNRYTADCLRPIAPGVRCPFIATALNPNAALEALLVHVEYAHPNGPKPFIADTMVDEPKGTQ